MTEAVPSYTVDKDGVKCTDNSKQVSTINSNTLKVGNVVTFGKYEQDAVTSNGSELIEWIVLNIEDNRALLISKYVLDGIKFSNESAVYSLYDEDPLREKISWRNSYVEDWLNDDFYNKAFSQDEKNILSETELLSKRIRYIGEYNSKEMREDIVSREVLDTAFTTTHTVFLLSVDEAERYMSPAQRAGNATQYALERANSVYANRDYSKKYCRWMCRDVMEYEGYASFLETFLFSYTASGDKIYNYYQWDDTRLIDVAGSDSVNGVRPAIVVDINKVQLIYG